MSDQQATEKANATQTDATQVASQSENAAQEVAQAFGIQIPQGEPAGSEETVEGQQQTGQEQQGDEPQEGTIEHKLQSWMGRKLAENNRQVQETIQQTLASFLGQYQGVQQQQQPIQQPVQIPDVGVDLEAIPTTNREILELMERREAARIAGDQKYWLGYRQELGRYVNHYKLNPDQQKTIQAEMDALGHQRQSTDPRISAHMNFHTALTNVLSKQLRTQKPAVPVSGKEPISATGVATSQKTDTARAETVQVDAITQQIANAFGMDAESLAKTVSASTPKGKKQ